MKIWISTKFLLTRTIWEALLCNCWFWYFKLAFPSLHGQGELDIPADLLFLSRLWAPRRDIVLCDAGLCSSRVLCGQWTVLLWAYVLYHTQPTSWPWLFTLYPDPDISNSTSLFNPKSPLASLLVSFTGCLKLYFASWCLCSSARRFYAQLHSLNKTKQKNSRNIVGGIKQVQII